MYVKFQTPAFRAQTSQKIVSQTPMAQMTAAQVTVAQAQVAQTQVERKSSAANAAHISANQATYAVKDLKEQAWLFSELEPRVNPHLVAAKRLSRAIRRTPDRSPAQTRTGQAICRHLIALLESSS